MIPGSMMSYAGYSIDKYCIKHTLLGEMIYLALDIKNGQFMIKKSLFDCPKKGSFLN